MDATTLLAFLRQQAQQLGGVARVPAGRVADGLGISRPTLMRAVQSAGDQLITMGQSRRRAYAARRPLRGQWAPLPVFEINAEGEPRQAGRLHLAHGHGCWFEGDLAPWPLDPSDAAMQDGWHEGLPYPLQDMRPEGFLGRAFARAHTALLQVPEDPRDWSDDDTLHALSLMGADTPGNLIVGEAAYQRWATQRLQPPTEAQATPKAHRTQAWLQRASQAMQAGQAGSSAAGEFPKFTAAVLRPDGQTRHVLVKFSGLDDSPGSRRWADLLVCEHLALQALGELGVPAARSRILQAGGRTFLEVDRFDRHGAHGRSPMCSWQALGNALLGHTNGPWPEAGMRLQQAGLIAKADAHSLRTLGLLWHFGRFIQNTDMHAGNVSFVPVGGHFQVAPAYDMLPMHHAPVRGVELPQKAYQVSLPTPDQFELARLAAQAAHGFWVQACQDERISKGFRALCVGNAEALGALMRVMG
jgi:hypothetical protein